MTRPNHKHKYKNKGKDRDNQDNFIQNIQNNDIYMYDQDNYKHRYKIGTRTIIHRTYKTITEHIGTT